MARSTPGHGPRRGAGRKLLAWEKLLVGALIEVSDPHSWATRSRCQRNSVATVTRKTPQRSRLSRRAKVARTARSVGEYRGRATCRRSTANW
jgi:hypothetical protein